MRVYEIAREVGIPNKDLLAKIRAMGLDVNNHMSSLDADDVARIRRTLEKDKGSVAAPAETKALGTTVVRRRSSKTDEAPAAAAPAAPAVAPVVRRRAHVEESPAPEAAPVAAPAVVEAAPVVAPPAPVQDQQEAREVVAERPAAPTRAREREAEPAEPAETNDGGSTEVRNVEASTVSVPSSAPVPAPELAPASAPSAPAPTPSAAEEAPLAAAPAGDRPRSRVIVNGPSVVQRSAPGGSGGQVVVEAPRPAPPPVQPPTGPNVIVRPRDPAREAAREAARERPPPPAGPRTVTEVAETARSRFEAELERARARTAEREPTAPAPSEQVAAEGGTTVIVETRDPGRPAVGSVISLPTRIKITERTPARGAAPAPPGPGQIRGRFAQQQQNRGPGGGKGNMRDFGKRRLAPPKGKGKSTQLTTPAEHKRVIRIEDSIAIADLARQMGIKATEVLKKLWGMGMTGVNINAAIDFDTAQILAGEFAYEVQNVAFKEESVFTDAPDDADKMTPRAPVVTIMGHVDHGKTSLLDKIRKSRVAAGEAGGITQHVAAYKVTAPSPTGEGEGREIVFLDTPGHEAFTEMRARGAEVTDIVVLVVAANDGVMPQTVEALNHAKEAKVTIIVAVNKIDTPDAQPERVRQQLADHGLIPEEWGGDTQYVNVSALKGDGIEKLLETIGLIAEMADYRANPNKSAQGTVIEARLDRARGAMATILIQEGTLKVGDFVVAGRVFGRVRAMLDHTGASLTEALPSTPVELLGLDGVPEAGDQVNVAEDERAAKQVVEHRRQAWRKRELVSSAKVSLEGLMVRMKESTDNVKELKIVLKADVQGSAEALKAALIKQTTEKVKVNVISAGVGGITESDVNLAKAGGAIIVGFHVRPAGKSSKLAEQEGVEIRLYDIIYDALDDVKLAMAGLLAPIKREVAMGTLEVRDTFTIPKHGTVAGCMVTSGRISRKALMRVIRDSVQVYEGKVSSLRRFKDDVSEVQNGYECGVMMAGFNDLKAGDVIEAYEVVEEAAKL